MPRGNIGTTKGAKFAKVGGMASAHAGPVVPSFAIFVSFVVKRHVYHLGPWPPAPGPLCPAFSPA
jgi:hypothetical protein